LRAIISIPSILSFISSTEKQAETAGYGGFFACKDFAELNQPSRRNGRNYKNTIIQIIIVGNFGVSCALPYL
jgi:hypothetical protein